MQRSAIPMLQATDHDTPAKEIAQAFFLKLEEENSVASEALYVALLGEACIRMGIARPQARLGENN